jgi:hypothetical protein
VARWFIILLMMWSAPSAAQELLAVHSDLPFLPKPGQTVSPFPCGGPKVIATCHEFEMGHWKEHQLCGTDECGGWMELWNYSPVHPALSFRETMTKDAMDPYAPAFLIRLTPRTERKQLYALEIGFLPGSRYMMLEAEGDMPKHAEVLDLRCEGEGATMRRSPEPISIFQTDYCSVASIDALERMAREALTRPPYETLDWIDDKKPAPAK